MHSVHIGGVNITAVAVPYSVVTTVGRRLQLKGCRRCGGAMVPALDLLDRRFEQQCLSCGNRVYLGHKGSR
jgi:hypothetical protein